METISQTRVIRTERRTTTRVRATTEIPQNLPVLAYLAARRVPMMTLLTRRQKLLSSTRMKKKELHRANKDGRVNRVAVKLTRSSSSASRWASNGVPGGFMPYPLSSQRLVAKTTMPFTGLTGVQHKSLTRYRSLVKVGSPSTARLRLA